MSDPLGVPTAATDARLRERSDEARANVLAFAADSGGASSTPLDLHAAAPVGPVPDEVRAKVTARVAAGLTTTGSDAPSAGVRRRVALPCAALVVIDLGVVALAARTWHPVLLIVAVVLLVPVAAIGFGAVRYAGRDPLALSDADRAAIESSCRWQSSRPWTDEPAAAGQERGLVLAALRAAENAAASPGWRSAELDTAGLRINLHAELDRIDTEAFELARERRGGRAGSDDPAWSAIVERVAALELYGDELVAAQHDPLDIALLTALLRRQADGTR